MTRLQKIALYIALGMGAGTAVYTVAVTEDSVRSGHVCVAADLVPQEQQGPEVHWFVAVSDTWTPSAGNGILDPGAGGVCYDYSLSSTAIGSWRLMAARGAPYHKARWATATAQEGATKLKMWRSYAGIKADCLGALSAAQCLSLMREVNDCWRVSADTMCIEGRKYAPGMGGVTAAGVPVTCTAGEIAGATPIPCIVAYGRSEADVE